MVLRPAGSITAFQRHVTRSLRRLHVGSPGSSPCWLDDCVSTSCDSITAAVPRWISCVYSSVDSVLFGSSPLYLSRHRTVQCSYSVLFGSSPCWLVHCVSTPCDSITAAVPRWFSLFFALLARSLRFNTMWLDHCGGSLRRFHVESPGSSPCWLDHCVSTPCDSNTAAVPRSFSWFFALLARSLRFNTM
jgi:hypothetical protein